MEQVLRIEPALLIGIDVLPDMLAAARQRLKHEFNSGNVVLLQGGDETPFPFWAQAFDRVYAGSVIGMQPVKIIRRIVAEVFRVLRPGGIFVVNEAIWREFVSEEKARSIYQACIRDFGLAPACDRAWNVVSLAGLL